MGWADSVKATALKVLVERKTMTGRAPANSLWTWNPYEVWLSRARPALPVASVVGGCNSRVESRARLIPE